MCQLKIQNNLIKINYKLLEYLGTNIANLNNFIIFVYKNNDNFQY